MPGPRPVEGGVTAATPGRAMAVVESDGTSGLVEWFARHGDAYRAQLTTAGAVLFRGFGVTSVGAFALAARELCGELFTENAEHTPVSSDGTVQTPVAFSPDRLLLWHNENSFNHEWPLRIAFCCVRPATAGGESPIVDSCLVYREVPAEVRRRFVEKGVAYVRNFGSGVGLDWRAIFRTDDRSAVDRLCLAHGIVAEWGAGDRLRTVAVRPAVVAHPVTGELSWFNQAQHWHPSCLEPDVRQALEGVADGHGLPRDCTFGDGTPIPDEQMQSVLEVYRRTQVAFPWQSGDVLALDNVLWAHGRNPYLGRRTMLVAMGSVHRPAGER
jgi:alpha-ketoglutarate-dependent taurine dioxygenase